VKISDIKISALAQIAVMLQDMPKAKGGQPYQDVSTGTQLVPVEPTLADLGLTKKQSFLAQKLAALPPEVLEQVKAGLASITKAIRQVVHAQRPPVAAPEERATPRRIR